MAGGRHANGAYPFVVTTSRGEIRVTGTTFNVTDYAGQPFTATLVEGAISFTSSTGKQCHLRPRQQAVYNDLTDSLRVVATTTEEETAWVEKTFLFRDRPLGEIMSTLSRWYDFTPQFADDSLRHERFSGRLRRGDDVDEFLQPYQAAGDLRFTRRGDTIIVSKN